MVSQPASKARTIGLVLTYNGERLLSRCLASLDFCDEVVVVDSLSTDATADIARAAGATVLTRRWEGPGPQFRFALEHIRAMPYENLDALREGFHLAVEASLGPVPLKATLKLDRELAFGDISHTLLKELEMLQPFGMGNPEPVFVSPPVLVKDYRVFGKDHVKLMLAEQLPADAVGARPGALLPAKAWRKAQELTRDVQGKLLRFAFTPRIDRFDGVPKIELQVKDWDA